ncbi:hepatocellular carcinoma-associated antigen 59-domain-containing protein [Aspergillus avenaceus]|uniref:Hepatocellular carcinoma-associated antigen 59-domain-containing protein n=1 Tax=Aspergillus avenaceus TaxID=36643 RepID=A0A5N6TD85_ASPAV|nr:hepatocellular carcinoma-associated antigen 59-domain-containing protein [Aspergillus avenaceus]
MDTGITSDLEPLFRPVKKRKCLRRRAGDTREDYPTGNEEIPGSTGSVPQTQGNNVHPSDLVRRRQFHRPRKGGIEFSAAPRPVVKNESRTVVSSGTAEDFEAEKIRDMCDRFTADTGQTVDVDKHMMAYIESEMAKRYHHNMSNDIIESDTLVNGEVGAAPSTNDISQREPAALGKLHEIDLGQETKLHNIARTEAATKRLVGDEEDARPGNEILPASRNLAGKDGNPRRNRGWRTNEDLERDRLVEEVLRESKLDVYEEPEDEMAMLGHDQAADDKVAEQFRRDFLDAIQSRRRVTRTKNAKVTKTEVPRGPKLGGSRSARAAMREMQDKQGRK